MTARAERKGLNMKKILTGILALVLCMGMLIGISACGMRTGAVDLLSTITRNEKQGLKSDEKFTAAYAEFAKKLYMKSASSDRNTLVSPLSVMTALSMTANGADGETLSQMENVLGGIKLEKLNEYLLGYYNGLYSADNCKLSIANSVWLRDGVKVKNPFLQDCADYYSAQIYREPFSDITKDKINLWVKDNTDGMIKKIIDDIDRDTVMYLINAIAFDAKWANKFERTMTADFTNAKGETEKAEFLCDTRYAGYFNVKGGRGTVIDYAGGRYGFAAILPDDENININEYFASLDSTELMNAIKGAGNENAYLNLRLPTFKFDFDIELGDALSDMGMPDAFSPKADFSRISDDRLYIGSVIHKTHIQLDKDGTKAAAVTKIETKATSAGPAKNPTDLYFDRPFIFMIVDNQTCMPIFTGTLVTTK